MEGLRPVLLEVGAHTIALSADDVEWLLGALAGRISDDPERYGLRTRLRLLRTLAEKDTAQPLILSKLQRAALGPAVEERLAREAAPSESIKLLASLLR